jgi:heterotetrameric sarcosine oxidase gamma subunit
VIEGRPVIEALPASALIALDLWSDLETAAARLGEALGGAMPALGRSGDLAQGWRAIRVEPTVWWLAGPLGDLDGLIARVETAIAGDGGATDLSGGFAAIGVTGQGWRELLMIGGVFDAESAAFGAGCTAGTLLHRLGVRYDVIRDDEVHIRVAPSHAADLLHHLRAAASRLDASEP